jgi:chitin disaccharide deacetylase
VTFLIVNADDFGYGAGVNRGVAEAHDRGLVTSAGLMVNAPGTEEAVSLAAARPRLSLGLHVNFTNEAQRLVEFDDPEVCRAELQRQLDRFVELTGRLPSHIDSHQHVHRRRPCLPSFRELARRHGLPLRDEPPVTFKGGFYGQLEYGVPEPERVGLAALERILREELSGGIYELACHPAYYDAAMHYVYHREREQELATLCDPRLRALVSELQLRLISYHELPAAVKELESASRQWAT